MGDIQEVLASPITALVAAMIVSGVALSDRLKRSISLALFVAAGLIAFFGLLSAHVIWSILVTLAIYALAIWARPEVVPKYFGKITPRRAVLFGETATHPKMEIGDSGAIFQAVALSGKLFNFFNKADLTVEVIRGRVLVSTKVTDCHGDIVAEILRNEWRAPPPKAWDRNYSKDAFEVKDSRGNIVLQVRALSDRVQLQGEWWDDEVYGVRLVSAGPGKGGLIAQFTPLLRPERTQSIKPLFRYPSETNLGKLSD